MPRGPGTLQTRVQKLRKALSEAELREAEKLASSRKYCIVQYAYYVASMKRLEAVQQEKIEKAENRKRRARKTLERLRPTPRAKKVQ